MVCPSLLPLAFWGRNGDHRLSRSCSGTVSTRSRWKGPTTPIVPIVYDTTWSVLTLSESTVTHTLKGLGMGSRLVHSQVGTETVSRNKVTGLQCPLPRIDVSNPPNGFQRVE